MRRLDDIDRRIIRELQLNARIPNVQLAGRVGLSPSACLRRLQLLEHAEVIRGYTAMIDDRDAEQPTVVLVQITLDRQTSDFLARFEEAIRKIPNVEECYLMSGAFDYVLRVVARDAMDYERIHTEQLSRLPGVARIQSSFAIRSVIRSGARHPNAGDPRREPAEAPVAVGAR